MVLDHDAAVVERLVGEARRALRRLEDRTALPADRFVEDEDRVAAVKYYLIVAVEACLDLGNHLIARNRYRAPEGYADTFRVLAEEGIIPEDLADRLEDMARFRNRLVHLYWDVDDRAVHGFAREDVEDVETFLGTVLDRLNEA